MDKFTQGWEELRIKIKDSYLELNERERRLGMLAGFAVAVLLSNNMIWEPRLSTMRELNKSIGAKEKEIQLSLEALTKAETEKSANTAGALKMQKEQLDERVKKAALALAGGEGKVLSILEAASRLGELAGDRLERVAVGKSSAVSLGEAPGARALPSALTQAHIQVELRGGWAQARAFIDQAQKVSPGVYLEEIEVRGGEQGTETTRVRFLTIAPVEEKRGSR